VSATPERRVAVIACTERDIFWLEYCDGCFERFPSLEAKEAHTPRCCAYRDFFIGLKLAAQRQDDGLPCSGEYDDLPDRQDCLRAGEHVCGKAP
jgi:hypothetical protein